MEDGRQVMQSPEGADDEEIERLLDESLLHRQVLAAEIQTIEEAVRADSPLQEIESEGINKMESGYPKTQRGETRRVENTRSMSTSTRSPSTHSAGGSTDVEGVEDEEETGKVWGGAGGEEEAKSEVNSRVDFSRATNPHILQSHARTPDTARPLTAVWGWREKNDFSPFRQRAKSVTPESKVHRPKVFRQEDFDKFLARQRAHEVCICVGGLPCVCECACVLCMCVT